MQDAIWAKRRMLEGEKARVHYVALASQGYLVCDDVRLSCLECPFAGMNGCPDYGPFGAEIWDAHREYMVRLARYVVDNAKSKTVRQCVADLRTLDSLRLLCDAAVMQ